MTDPQGRVITYTYDQIGQRTQLTYPSGLSNHYTYNILNRLTNLVQRQGPAVLASYTYTLGLAGNRLGVVEVDGRSIQWTYDDADRLLGETRRDSTGTIITQTTFTYDPVGNRLTQTLNGQTTNYAYNLLDQLTSAGATQYHYDGRGNLIQITDGTNVTHYTYDAADRLVGAVLPGGVSLDYGYDAAGRRVQQTVGSNTTNYLWDEASPYGDVVLETDGSGVLLVNYVLADTTLLSQNRGGTISDYLYDGQSNVRGLADVSGNLTDGYTYTAFGELLDQQGTTINSYRYSGQQFDTLTGLYSLRARYYQPQIGRFLSRDTADLRLADPVELNRYVYVANNPINAVDPTGYQALIEYSNLESEDTGAEAAIEEEGGSLAQDVYDNIIEDSVEDLNSVNASDPVVQDPSRIELAKTSGHWGEQQFAQQNGNLIPKVRFDTEQGLRVVDFFDEANQTAYEVKTGYQSLSSRIGEEIAKDAEMLFNGDVKEIVWEFYRSPINGKIGASQPLLDLLAENFIKVVIH